MAGDEDERLRSVALQNARAILVARQRAEAELARAKRELEANAAELAQALAMTRATLESTADGIMATDAERHMTAINAKLVSIWALPAGLVHEKDERKLVEHVSRRFADPAAYLARVDAIYAASPLESFDLLERADGTVVERFSKVQVLDGRHVGRV